MSSGGWSYCLICFLWGLITQCVEFVELYLNFKSEFSVVVLFLTTTAMEGQIRCISGLDSAWAPGYD